jgi:hypothetical protein
MQHASWLIIALINVRLTSEKQPTYKPVIFGKAVDLLLGVFVDLLMDNTTQNTCRTFVDLFMVITKHTTSNNEFLKYIV